MCAGTTVGLVESRVYPETLVFRRVFMGGGDMSSLLGGQVGNKLPVIVSLLLEKRHVC